MQSRVSCPTFLLVFGRVVAKRDPAVNYMSGHTFQATSQHNIRLLSHKYIDPRAIPTYHHSHERK
jgi:hypothetical protein